MTSIATLATLFAILFAPAAVTSTRASSFTCVATPHGDPYTIQGAVNDPRCTTIRLVTGTYAERITIARDVTIIGVGADRTIIDGGAAGRVVEITSGTVTLSDIAVRNGVADEGDGVRDQGTLVIVNSTISNNSGKYTGAGISNLGTLTITNSTTVHNTAFYNGGGVKNGSGDTIITNSTIAHNTARHWSGGGIYNVDRLRIEGSTISGNRAGQPGGGIADHPMSSLLIGDNMTFSDNNPNDCAGPGCPKW